MLRCGTILLRLLLVAVACGAAGCGRSLQRKILFEGVERFEQHGTAGFDLALRVDNRSGRDLRLERGELLLYMDGVETCRATLVGAAVAPRRMRSAPGMRWRMRVADPLRWRVCEKRIREGEIDRIGVSFDARVSAGAAGKNISAEMMPLSDFLAIFELSIDDLRSYLE